VGARRDFPIDADYAGGRLETFLRRKLGLPRTLALKALRKGWIRVGGKRSKAETRLESGSVVTVTNPALKLPALEGDARPRAPVPEPFVRAARASVRHADDDVVVSAKPGGEVVHAGTGHATGWVDALRAALGATELVPIGRLDRDTSGLLLLGRTRAASRALFESLRENRVSRTYFTLVLGRPRGERGTIDAPLEKLADEDGLEQVAPSEMGKPALTRWEVARRLPGATLLRVTIETGRTHQIRAHLASIGHPLLGDPRQRGTTGGAGELARRAGLTRLFLHAGELEFPHPTRGEIVRFEEPLPRELARTLEQLEHPGR
jgi:RluA family pseudouridine synthase